MTPELRTDLAERARSHPPTAGEIELACRLAVATAGRWHVGPAAQGIDQGDLEAEARAEAWRQLLTYDPTRQVALSTWIIVGCRRAVMEALRRADPLTRDERRRFRAEQEANPEATPPRQFTSLEGEMREINQDDDGYCHRVDLRYLGVLGPLDPDIESLPARLDARRLARIAMTALPDLRMRRLTLWKLHGWTDKRIGKRCGICESRVHQIWAEARAIMRFALEVEERRWMRQECR